MIRIHDISLIFISLDVNSMASVILVISSLTILLMLPISSLLNKSEVIPDWKVKDEERKKRDDELITRLKRQANLELFEVVQRQRDVYDQTFPENTKLSPELIEQLHSRPITFEFYYLHIWTQRLRPTRDNHVGPRHLSVRATDYLNVTGQKWF